MPSKKSDKSKKRAKVALSFDDGSDDGGAGGGAADVPASRKKRRMGRMKPNYAAVADEASSKEAAPPPQNVYSEDYLAQLRADNEQVLQAVPEAVEDDVPLPDDLPPPEAVAPELLGGVDVDTAAADVAPTEQAAQLKEEDRYDEYTRHAEAEVTRKRQGMAMCGAVDKRKAKREREFRDDSSSDDVGLSFEEQQMQRAAAMQGVVIHDTAEVRSGVPAALLPEALPHLSMPAQLHKLREQAVRMRERASVSQQGDSRLQQMLDVTRRSIEELEQRAHQQQKRYYNLQGMRDYVESLGSCYEALMGDIKQLLPLCCEQGAARHASGRANRKQWSADEAREMDALLQGSVLSPDAAHMERVARRDAGWGVAQSLAGQSSAVADKRASLMAGVDAEYGSIEEVRRHLEQWRLSDEQSYRSVAEPSLVLCFEPFISMDLAGWDPLCTASPTPLSSLPWVGALEPYSKEAGMASGIRSYVTAEMVVPHLADYIAAAYDPLSEAQTRRLAAVVEEAAGMTTPAGMQKLCSGVSSAVREAVASLGPCPGAPAFREEDVSAGGEAQGLIADLPSAYRASRRRYGLCLKLADNLSVLQGCLPEEAAADLFVQEALGCVAAHLLCKPLVSFPCVAEAAGVLADELSKVPNTWFSLELCAGQPQAEEKVRRRTAKLQQFLHVATQAFGALRQSLGREAHSQMLEAAKAFKRLCDHLGDRTALRLILG